MTVLQNKKQFFIILNTILVIIWCGTIFYFSAQTAAKSGSQSFPISKGILGAVDKLQGKSVPDQALNKEAKAFDGNFREAAHSIFFFILAILVVNLLRLLRIFGWKAFFITIIFCVVYSLSDEIHQLFVPGRAFQLVDLMLDFVGVILGLGIYMGVKSCIVSRSRG